MAQDDRISILRGMRAAERLHRDLRSRQSMGASVLVDVFDTIARAGAVLMFKPLDPLLGAYMREGDLKGIMVTLRRPIGVQRFTAAHELGHLIMDHEPHADDDNILRRSPLEDRRSKVPPHEREADAFASNFLLPKFVLSKLHGQQKWELVDYHNPHTLYQASLRFGASYRATVFAYERDKIISRRWREELLKTQPRDLKAELVDGRNVEGWGNRDVWRLTEKDEGVVIEANREDLFVLKLKEHSGSGYLWTYDELKSAGFVVLKDVSEAIVPDRIGGVKQRYVIGETEGMSEGTFTLREARPWNPDIDVKLVTVHYRHAVSREDGQYSPQLARLVGTN